MSELPVAGDRKAHLRNVLIGLVGVVVGGLAFVVMKQAAAAVLLGWIWAAVGIYGILFGVRSEQGLLRLLRIPFAIAVGLGGTLLTLVLLSKG